MLLQALLHCGSEIPQLRFPVELTCTYFESYHLDSILTEPNIL
jgi:hypothetical protein